MKTLMVLVVVSVMLAGWSGTGAAEEALLDASERQRVQIALAAEGFDPGPADGKFGPRTRGAIKAWQRANGYTVTGELTRGQAQALLVGVAPPASGTETARVRDIPDKATRERVADWLDGCVDTWRNLQSLAVPHDVFSSDKKTREFLSWIEKRSHTTAATIREYIRTCVAVGKAVNESGRSCEKLAREVHRSVRPTNFVTRYAESYLDRDDRLDDTQRRAVEDYLRMCVSAYATVLEGRPLQPYRAGDKPAEVAATAPTTERGPLYGAITFSQEDDGGYAWGIAWRFGSRANATEEAIEQCRREGGTECAEAGWFRDACGALAIGDENGYGAGWGRTRRDAETDALAQCRAANDNCRLEVARCSQSEEDGGSGRTDTAAIVGHEPDDAPPSDTSDGSCEGWIAPYTFTWNEEGIQRGGSNGTTTAWGATKAEAEAHAQQKCSSWSNHPELSLMLVSCVVGEAKCR